MKEYRTSGLYIQSRIDGGIWSDIHGADYTPEEIAEIKKNFKNTEGDKKEEI